MAKPETITSHELIEIIDALDEGKDFATLLLMACSDLNEDNASPLTRCVGEVLGRINAARKVALDAQGRLSTPLVRAA